MNKEVNLTKRVLTKAGVRYCPAVFSANGRVKQDTVIVNGNEEKHKEGSYYLEWRQGAKRVRVSVGKNSSDAFARFLRKHAELNAINQGVAVTPELSDGRRSLAAAIADYLDETELSKKPRSYNAYSNALTKFQASCHKTYLDEVDRKDMVKFAAFLRDEKKLAPRSVYNLFEHMMTFFKWAKIRDIVGKNDWPRYTEEVPTTYEPEELEKLFAACTPEEKVWYQFFQMTGEREQEVMHTCWSEVNLVKGLVRVTHKPEFSWTPKAYKEREIPVSSKLVKSLTAWKKKADKSCPLLFPTSGCRPKFDFLDCLKAVAKRAKLNPDDCYLHKFRATFATRCLQNGVDLRTVQEWLGHSDIESTMRYLRPARNE